MRVGLFVTCLVDTMRPEIGFSALKLLEAAGAALAEQDRARRVEVDRGRDHRHQRRGQREADGSSEHIDRAFGDSNAAKHDRVYHAPSGACML